MIKVALIIVTYNSKKFLPELLQSISQLNTANFELNTIIVDNDSQDGTLEYLQKQKQIELIANSQNLGFAEGNNIAIRRALQSGADYVALINPDTVLTPDCLQELVLALVTKPQAGAAQALLMLWPLSKKTINSWGNQLHFLGFGYAGGYGQPLSAAPTTVKPIPYASGASVCYRARALQQSGLFDESYFIYHEDTELSLKLKLKGWQVVLAPQALIYHKYEPQKSRKTLQFIEQNRLRLIIEFYKLPTLLLLAPAILMSEFGLWLLWLFSRPQPNRLKIYHWLINHWSIIKNKRRLIQSSRQINDQKLCEHITGCIYFEIASQRTLLFIINPLMRLYWLVVKNLIWW